MLPPSLRSYVRNNIQYFLFQPHQSRGRLWNRPYGVVGAVPNKNSRMTPGFDTTNPPPSRALLHA